MAPTCDKGNVVHNKDNPCREIFVVTTDHKIKDALAAVLRETCYAWPASEVVNSEITGTLKGNKVNDLCL